MALTVDEMLERIGSLGLYQVRLVAIIMFIEGFNMVFQIMTSTFVAAEPPWHCVRNATNCTLEGNFRPGSIYYNYRCKIPREQWEFESGFTSIVTEYDFVCDKTYLASLASSMIFAGWFIGSLLGGWIADKYGRRPVVYVSAIMISLCGLVSAIPKVFWFYVLFRFLIGICRGCGNGSQFVILTEYVGIRHRHIGGTLMWFAWPIAINIMIGIAYATRDWRLFSIISGAVGLPVVFTWWFIPESTHFLLVKGNVTQCEKTLRDVARINKKKYPDETLKDPNSGKKARLADFRDLFSSRIYANRTFILWYVWITCGLVIFGVLFTVPDLGGNIFVNFAVTANTGILSTFGTIFFTGRLGRRKTLIASLIVAAFAAIGGVVISFYDPGNNQGYYIGRVIMAIIAVGTSAIAFDTAYVYTAELFPTTIRNVAVGSSTAAARIGAFAAPFVAALNRIHVLLPYAVFGLSSLIAGSLCTVLPETKGVPTEEVPEPHRSQERTEEHEVKLLNQTK